MTFTDDHTHDQLRHIEARWAAVLQAGLLKDRRHLLAAARQFTDDAPPGWECATYERVDAAKETILEDLWLKGWMPADAARHVSRVGSTGEVAAFAQCLGIHMQQYAGSSVHPRFSAQVDDVTDDPSACALYDMHHTVAMLVTLYWLQPLEPIVPPPGEYLRPAGGPNVDVDERLLKKVRALLAKAESTEFDAEAETFTEAAQKLMARHSIDAALLASTGGDGTKDGPQTWRIGAERPYEAAKMSLLAGIASANQCRSVWFKPHGFASVSGFEADLRAVDTLYTSLLLQATAAMQRAGTKVRRDGTSRTRAFRGSFLEAFAQRITERLHHARDEVVSSTAASTSALLPVLAARSEEVDEELSRVAPRVRMTRRRSVSDRDGWASGLQAANDASLAPGAPLSG